ncbi:prenyltransferase [Bowmanella sp. JS7-9]|uniref:Prenyltransferase n=1 Tax=Pseudobowmanella zhangzhouensis TaxID=1537679 RepID=A0ABW1XEE9_9ALTE|nr:prenyltransferase [Bowmanella sp. JS7-9]TBX20909.1 hypothetical protein TK45_14190 [Bowmanella sp. JS7-9]
MLKALLGVIRVPFLLLAPLCVFAGSALALHEQGAFNGLVFSLCIVIALTAHSAVNALNEWHDFKTGLDSLTTRTPFNGGSGTLQAHPHFAPIALFIGIIMLLICMAAGIWLSMLTSPWLLLAGLVGLLIVTAYTPIITRHPLLCLIAPGLGFAALIMGGSYVVMGGHINLSLLLLVLASAMLLNNLLLVNQFPDITADAHSGRRTLPIVFDQHVSRQVVLAQFITSSLLLGLLAWHMANWALLLAAALPLLGIHIFRGIGASAQADPSAMLNAQRLTVLVNLVTPALISLLLSAPFWF